MVAEIVEEGVEVVAGFFFSLLCRVHL